MNLDELAREASQDAYRSGRTMPIVPIERLHRRRLLTTVAPIVAGGLAVWVAIIVFVTPPVEEAPVATSDTTSATEQTTTTTEASTTTTTVPTSTTTGVTETFAPIDAAWVRSSFTEITDPEGNVLFEIAPSFNVGRPVVSDGGNGFVVATDTGLQWVRPSGTQTIDAEPGNLIAGAFTGTTWIVGVQAWDEENPRWIDLSTGEEIDAPADDTRTLDGTTYQVGNRTATIVDPDWSDVARAEDGAPIAPFDLPELVVTEDGTEVLRIPVGTERRPYVVIQDFDGRRLILTAWPQEPALPPSTVWIIDLECAECTQMIETDGTEWFDLIGTIPSEGAVVAPDLP